MTSGDKSEHKQETINPEESLQKVEAAIDWLCKTFPRCFNIKKPAPLKRGIEQDIFPYLPKDGSISKSILKAAIAFYTRNIHYQQAVHSCKRRFDLEGNAVDTVSKDDKTYAAQRVEWVESKLHKAGIADKKAR